MMNYFTDVLTYAKQIGIDVVSEKHLMWIAEKGLTASVPEPWLILYVYSQFFLTSINICAVNQLVRSSKKSSCV